MGGGGLRASAGQADIRSAASNTWPIRPFVVMVSSRKGLEGNMRRLPKGLICLLLAALFAQPSLATNTPCSGRKGGISHCQGRTFICNDGSVSASKKDCSAEYGGGSDQALGLMGSDGVDLTPTVNQSECSCRSGHYCIGPRGGHYCLTDGGAKSYLRK